MKKNYDLLMSIAEKHDLEVVTTTTGDNGYPEHIERALTGFSDKEQMEQVARENGGEIVALYKHDGWDLWQRDNAVHHEIDVMESYAECEGYHTFLTEEDALDAMKSDIEACETIEDCKEALELYDEICTELANAEDDEFVLEHDGSYEVLKQKDVWFDYDSQAWTFGVILND